MNTTLTNCAEKKAKQFLNLLQGYTKGIRITAILILLLMGVSNAWAWTTYYLKSDNTTWDTGNNGWEFTHNTTTTTYMANGSKFKLWRTDWGGDGWFGVNNSTLKPGDGGLQFKQYENNVQYNGPSGMVCFHMDQSSNRENSPWVWITRPTFYLKHNWSGDSWTWKALTDNQDGTYQLTDYYGGTGVNYGDNNSSQDGWGYVTATTTGTLANGNKCIFTFNSADKTINITRLYTIKYDGNGSTTGVPSEHDKKHGTNTALSSSTPTRTGYTFAEWNTKADGSGTNYAKGATYSANADVTLYAKWTAHTYTVAFNANGGTGTMSNQNFTYGTAKNLTANTFTRTGYTFAGWNTKADGTGTSYTDKQSVNNLTPTNGATVTLYAKWTANTYTVAFNANGGTGTMSNQNFTYGTTKNLTANTFTRTGYTFAGWNTKADGSGTSYTDKQSVSNLTSTNGATITLYAKWTANTNTAYTVKHYKQLLDDTYSATPDETENLTGTTDASVTPTVKSYTGFTAPSAQTVTIKADGSTVVTYKYTRNKHTLTWNLDGGDITEAGTAAGKVAYGTTLAAPTVQKDGHTFTGWSPAVPATMPDNDVTCTAQWTANTYTITLDQEGATTTGTTSMTVTYDAEMPTITCPTKNGYAFMGYWDAKEGAGNQYYKADGTSARTWDKDIDNTTLYAFFKKAEITSITLDKTLFGSGETGYVTVTNHTIEPTPAGTVVVCWTLCYNNGTPVEGHNAIEENGTVKFAIDGLSTGTYKIMASLRLNDRNGEELDRAEATFLVAGSYTVTIKYTCDGQEIAGRTTIEGHPSRQTPVTAAEIGGYNFVKWELGDGISTEDALTDKTINITANYEGYLTATYEKKKLIFLDLSKKFGKTDWPAPHIYLYSEEFWNENLGTGATDPKCVDKGAMSPVPGTTGMWFYEYEKVKNFNGYVAFTPTDKKDQANFYDTEVIHRGDFSIGTPVFVPAEGQTANIKNPSEGKNAQYYNKGHWTKYMGGTGYTLKIYNHKEEEGRKELMSVPFTGSSIYLPFTAVVDLEAGQTFGYKIVRDNDKWYKNDNDGTMTVNSHTNWPFVEDNSNGLACGIQTVAAGNHTFTLTLNATSGNFEVSVDYPVTVGDYRILYKDNKRTTYKPSDIKKAKELNPVTSFFIRPNSNPELKIQTAAHITDGGVTWANSNGIYFRPNSQWKDESARFAAYFYNGSKNEWKELTKNGDIYSCEKPSGYTHVIFVRLNPAGKGDSNNNNGLHWNYKWNQTGHLSLPKDDNLYELKEGLWGNKIYLKPNSEWKSDGARFAAYFYEGEEHSWMSMNADGDGIYSCDIPAENNKMVIFCRMTGANATNNWENKWNQTSNLTVPTDGKLLYTVKDGAWDNGGGTWSVGEGTWNKITGSITDLTEELKEKLGEIKGDIRKAPDSVYTIHLEQNNGTFSVAKVVPYTGNFYIRVDAAAGKWYDYKTNPDNLMTYSAFSESKANSFGEKFSHYKTEWCSDGMNVKFVIANDYSPCISDTLVQDTENSLGNIDVYGNLKNEDKYNANIRFMWNRRDNKVSRAYVAAATNDAKKFLVLKTDKQIKNNKDELVNEIIFQDTQNWIYEYTIKAKPGTRVKLYACYPEVNEAKAQYFRGKYDNSITFDENNSVHILGGTGEAWNTIRVLYDFKTNRLMGAWVPESAISTEQAIAADLMVIRRHQENATCVTLTNENSKLTDVKTAYGAMQFNRWTINNRGGADDLDVKHCTKLSGSHRVYDEDTTNLYHPILPLAEQTSIYERGLYFISFPFDVHLSDVFGFGTYGTHWVISTYNGKRRAERGYFAEDCINEDCTNWDYIWDPSGFVMKANEGYLLSLDLDLMKHDNTSFWANNISQVELFFPSTAAVKSIEKTDYTMPALGEEYLCKINHNTPDGDRRVKDSYWRCIGVPSFADYDGSLTTDGESTINWKDDYTWEADKEVFPFLYEWNVTNNDLVVRSTNSYKFRATYAYLIQNGNEIHWSAVNTKKPTSIIARDQTENVSNFEWKIALLRNDAPADHTFIRMTDNESVTSAFDFHQDLSKEFNYGANIYTLVGYERLAANSLPCSDKTTIIPLGLNIEQAGDYTIAMPEGVENIGITLVDNETGIHTNLSAGQEYTLTLNKGICENRLFIEVSPIQNTPTDLEYTTEDTREQTTRKVLINEKLYIIRDGVVYDAQGHRL